MSDNINIFDENAVQQNDDIEALQTDTMRFLAILAICLMVIFSLVQAMPLKPPVPPTIEPFERRIKELENRIDFLLLIERNLKTEIQKYQEKIDGLGYGFNKTEEELNNVYNELKKEREKLNKLRQDIRGKEAQSEYGVKQLSEINIRIDEGNKALDSIEQRLRELLEKAELDSAIPKPHRNGRFTLTFEDAEAMVRLIRNKKISFYAGFKDRYWKLRMVKNAIFYEGFQGEVKLYPLVNETVPDSFKKALGAKIASFSKDSIRYYVDLPNDIIENINTISTTCEGGNLVIQSDGTVLLR